jgi:hypothetical protein
VFLRAVKRSLNEDPFLECTAYVEAIPTECENLAVFVSALQQKRSKQNKEDVVGSFSDLRHKRAR